MPDWGPDIRARLLTVRLSPAREAEVIEELSQHLEERWRELVAGGTPAEEAIRIARPEFSRRNLLAPALSPLRQAHWTDPVRPGPDRTALAASAIPARRAAGVDPTVALRSE